MAAQLGEAEQVLHPHLVNRQLAGEGARHLVALEAEDGTGLGSHLQRVNDQQALDPFELRQQVEPQGAAVDQAHLFGEAVSLLQRLHGEHAEGVVLHQAVAQPQNQRGHHRSSGSTYLQPPKMPLMVPLRSLTSISQAL